MSDPAGSTPDLDPWALQQQVCFALSVAARSVVAIYRPLLEPMGLTWEQVKAYEGGYRVPKALLVKFGRLYRRPLSWFYGSPLPEVELSGMENLSEQDRTTVREFAQFLAWKDES